jgi:predicted permease
MPEFFRKLIFFVRRRELEQDLDEEMRHHLDMKAAAQTSAEARQQFGNITRLKEDGRAAFTWTWLEQLAQDLRYALRAMANNRGFTALAALSLALGIGANTAIYSFMDAILLRSLPVQEPESLVMLNWRQAQASLGAGKAKQLKGNSVVRGMMALSSSTYADPNSGLTSGVFSYPAFELFQKESATLASVFAHYSAGNLNVTIRNQSDLAAGEYVSGDYFRGLGIPPAAGRLLFSADDQAGAPAVAVVSHSFSQRRLGGPANAVGQTLLVNNTRFDIVGVTPPEFFGVDPSVTPDFYVPLHANLLLEPSGPFGNTARRYLDEYIYWIEIMARLRPGVNITQAQATLAPMFHQFVNSLATNDRERSNLPQLVVKQGAGGLDGLRRRYSKPLYVLMTLVGLILAIACANIANLLLSRATARRREMAVRLSMGAGRFRVIRQLLTESALLACLGGAAGVLFAFWGIRFLTVLLANGQPNFTLRAELNWHVLAVTLALSVATGILFGLAPALQATRVEVMPALKESRAADFRVQARRSPFRLRLNQVLVVTQITISLLMLVAAGLFVRTLSNLQSIDLGFNRENVLQFQLNALQAGYRGPELTTFYEDLQKRFVRIPGVRSASLSNLPVIGGGMMNMLITVAGVEPGPTKLLSVGPGFFSTMQIPMLLGREMDERDQPGSPLVAVVNESFAKAYFGAESAIGRHIMLGGPPGGTGGRDMEIIGVSGTARYGSLKQDFEPVVYIPYNQGSFPLIAQMTYELRVAGDPLGQINTVREIVHQADARVPVSNVKTLATQIDQTINQEIIFAQLCTGFAMLALAIACVGLYGTVSYGVARRTNEIGIRMALGAARGRVIWMVLRQVVLMAAIGLAIGLPLAFSGSRLVESLLFGLKPNDPLALAAAAGILLAAAIAAGLAPARRASRIDPMAALRHE